MDNNEVMNTQENTDVAVNEGIRESLSGSDKAIVGLAVFGAICLCRAAYKKAIKPGIGFVKKTIDNRKKPDVVEGQATEVNDEFEDDDESEK